VFLELLSVIFLQTHFEFEFEIFYQIECELLPIVFDQERSHSLADERLLLCELENPFGILLQDGPVEGDLPAVYLQLLQLTASVQESELHDYVCLVL